MFYFDLLHKVTKCHNDYILRNTSAPRIFTEGLYFLSNLLKIGLFNFPVVAVYVLTDNNNDDDNNNDTTTTTHITTTTTTNDNDDNKLIVMTCK